MKPHEEHGVHENPQFFLASKGFLIQLVHLPILTPKVRLLPLGLFMQHHGGINNIRCSVNVPGGSRTLELTQVCAVTSSLPWPEGGEAPSP